MSKQPVCPSWVDTSCVRPLGHNGAHYNEEDDILWMEPSDDERRQIAQEDGHV